MVMSSKGPAGAPVVIVAAFYNGEEEIGRQKFAKLIELGPIVNRTGMMPSEVVNTLQNAVLPQGANYHLTGTIRGEGRLQSEAARDIFNKMIEMTGAPGACLTDGGPVFSIIWQFINLKKVTSLPADASALRMRTASPCMSMVIRWEGDSTEASKDAKDRVTRLKDFIVQALEHTFPNGLGENDTGYGNFGA